MGGRKAAGTFSSAIRRECSLSSEFPCTSQDQQCVKCRAEIGHLPLLIQAASEDQQSAQCECVKTRTESRGFQIHGTFFWLLLLFDSNSARVTSKDFCSARRSFVSRESCFSKLADFVLSSESSLCKARSHGRGSQKDFRKFNPTVDQSRDQSNLQLQYLCSWAPDQRLKLVDMGS